MDIESFREYCLSFDGVREDNPFDHFYRGGKHSILVFFVMDKMFCYFDIYDFEGCTIKCDPEQIVELKEHYRGIGDPYNANRKYWISVAFHSDVPDDKLKELVRKSYDLVVEGLSRKERKKNESRER